MECKNNVCQISGHKRIHVLKFLQMIYDSRVSIELDEIDGILALSLKYQVSNVRQFIVKTLFDSAVDFKTLIQCVGEGSRRFPSISVNLESYWLERMETLDINKFIVSSEVILLDSSLMSVMLTSDKLAMDEIDLYALVLDWAKRKTNWTGNDTEILKQPLENIRFGLFTKDELMDTKENDTPIPLELYMQSLEVHIIRELTMTPDPTLALIKMNPRNWKKRTVLTAGKVTLVKQAIKTHFKQTPFWVKLLLGNLGLYLTYISGKRLLSWAFSWVSGYFG